MSKREDYNLTFYRKNIEGRIINICSYNGNGINSVLTFIDGLSNYETTSLIDDLQKIVDIQHNIDEGFYTGSIGTYEH